MLRVNDIDVFYGDLQVLWNVSFEVMEKEILVLIGANGAGKSTTIKTISSLLVPTKGNIEFNGIPINGSPPTKLSSTALFMCPKEGDCFRK